MTTQVLKRINGRSGGSSKLEVKSPFLSPQSFLIHCPITTRTRSVSVLIQRNLQEDEGGFGFCNVHGILENGPAMDSQPSHPLLEPPFHLDYSSFQIITSLISILCIVTGVTSGLGAAAAMLSPLMASLWLLTMMEIKRKNESVHLKAFKVDLSSFQSILQFKASLQQWLSDLHALFNPTPN